MSVRAWKPGPMGWACALVAVLAAEVQGQYALPDYRTPAVSQPPGPFERLPELFDPVSAPADNGREFRGPIIPEPMVFDMVRPLGARRGELEVNVLGLVPLKRDGGAPAIEWAPEVEWAIRDGFAVEFELPFRRVRQASLRAPTHHQRFWWHRHSCRCWGRSTGKNAGATSASGASAARKAGP
jgi:hypothetical protein